MRCLMLCLKTGFKPNPANKVMNVSMHGGTVIYDIEGLYAMTRGR